MKRVLVASLLFAVVVGVMLYFMPQSYSQQILGVVKNKNAEITVYCRETTLQSVDLGFGKMISCNADNFTDVLFKCGKIDGVSASFNGTYDEFVKLQKDLDLKNTETQNLNEVYVVCGRCDNIGGGVIVDGNYVNCQIAYSHGTITVGFPLILGSY